MNLTEHRLYYKPFEYPKAYEFYRTQQLVHWIKDEIKIAEDLQNWHYNLTETERNVIGGILKGFTQCYDNVTEILTDGGWKLFDNLTLSDKVAQVVDGRNIEFVIPIDIYKETYSGKMHLFKDEIGRVDLCVTPNHRMYYRKTYTGEFKIERSQNLKWGQKKQHLITGVKQGSINFLTPDERIWIAYQADGISLRHDGSKIGKIVNQIKVLKESKKSRLRELLKNSSYEWEEIFYNKNNDVYSNFKIYTKIPIPKHFDWIDITNISTEWANEFIDELQYWDSHIDEFGKIIYSNTNKYDIDIVHIIALYTGKYVTHGMHKDDRKETFSDCHYIAIQRNKEGYVNGQSMKRAFKEIDYNGFIHCVTVPSGIIVVRRNNKTSISGNTEVLVGDYWRKVCQWFPKAEIAMMCSTFSYFENIHQDAYALINETLGLDDFTSFLYDPSTRNKLEYFIEIENQSTIEQKAASLAIFSAFAEGCMLFSSFAILLSFQKENLMKGISQIVNYSIRDEQLHSEGGCWLFNTLCEENEGLREKIKEEVIKAAIITYELEEKFIDNLFNSNKIRTINSYDLKEFIKHRINTKLLEIGYTKIYEIDNNALLRMEWFDALSSAREFSDFFSNRVSEYTQVNYNTNDLF